jgi:hypothetical protein
MINNLSVCNIWDRFNIPKSDLPLALMQKKFVVGKLDSGKLRFFGKSASGK